MLRDWQLKFPNSFVAYPHIFTQLTLSEQDSLSSMLTLIERTELGLLDEQTVNCLLEKSISYLPDLVYLITLLIELHSLNKPMLHLLFTTPYLPELKNNISTLSTLSLISADSIVFLLSTQKMSECIAFIMRASGLDFFDIKNFLSRHIAQDGLGRTITLFDLSSFAYRKEHFQLFSIVTEVLANPLAQTIFDARLRCFSDYSLPTEPLQQRNADEIIQQVNSLEDPEQRIRVFFNFFAQLRPFPESQKYLVAIDVASKVDMELLLFCESTIAKIQNQHDYLQVREMINTLRMKGGNKFVFDQIKYAVASEIESEDFCSTRSYEQLMDEIWQALIKPQATLGSFVALLQESKGYREYVGGAAFREKALFMSPVLRDSSIDGEPSTVIDPSEVKP